jgi:hypothetical protein
MASIWVFGHEVLSSACDRHINWAQDERVQDPLGSQTLMKSNAQLRHEGQDEVPQPPLVQFELPTGALFSNYSFASLISKTISSTIILLMMMRIEWLFYYCGFSTLFTLCPFETKKGGIFLTWTRKVFFKSDKWFLSQNGQRGSLLVCVGCILFDKITIL